MTATLRHSVAWCLAAVMGVSLAGSASAGDLTAASVLDMPASGQLNQKVRDLALKLGRPAGHDIGLPSAALPSSLAGPIALLLDALENCHDASVKGLSGISLADLSSAEQRLGAEAEQEIADCADDLNEQAGSVQMLLRSMARAELQQLPRFDVWPVIRFEPSASHDTYLNDYMLIIDAGGDDSYLNNAGGNLIDINFGPEGTQAPSTGPAKGCQNIPSMARNGCIASSALLLDLGGDDTYGMMQTPDEDARFESLTGAVVECTRDLVVRRIGTGGSGVAGAGFLIDDSGDDHYLGKTVSLGSGHVSGIGVLRDYGSGDDSYLAIRNSQGAGLVGGLGILWDEAGNDTYDHYMPAGDDVRPGGVVSDKNVCDSQQRDLLGFGLVGGVGVLQDDAGADSYNLPTRSGGAGYTGGAGVFWDSQGRDFYLGESARTNSTTTYPSAESAGLFVDEGEYPEESVRDEDPPECDEGPMSSKSSSHSARQEHQGHERPCPAWGGRSR